MEEILPFFRRGVPLDPKLAPLALADAGSRSDVQASLARVPPSALLDTARAIVGGELLDAAAPLAAQGRRAEAEAQLAQALAFFHSVGATRFIRAAEAVLAGRRESRAS